MTLRLSSRLIALQAPQATRYLRLRAANPQQPGDAVSFLMGELVAPIHRCIFLMDAGSIPVRPPNSDRVALIFQIRGPRQPCSQRAWRGIYDKRKL